ncbi:alpha/beta hydrolase [Lentisphaera marina]|nr:alpha/beta hydrolase [Lentisphaera marina]MDD7984687.1 alpha/beta hydrolase [Lentisphaera marina]
MNLFSLLIMFGTIVQANDLRYFAEHDKREIKNEIIDSKHQLRLISSLPDNWQESDKRPAFVFIHGGGWVAGEPENFIPQMRYFASRGAVCFSVNYRLLKPKNYRWNKKLSDEENKINEQKKLQEFVAGPSLTELISDCEKAMITLCFSFLADDFVLSKQKNCPVSSIIIPKPISQWLKTGIRCPQVMPSS